MASKIAGIMGCFCLSALPITRSRPFLVSETSKEVKEAVGRPWYRCNRRTALR